MTGDVLYRRRQIAWPVIAPLAVVAALLIPFLFSIEQRTAILVVAVFYSLILLLFATLTVSVTSDGVAAVFGVGLIRKWIPFSEIVSFERMRTNWRHGFGIHGYRGGTLYNASGFQAVEFLLTSGRYVAIGTPEPEVLVAVLRQATGKAEAAHEPLTARAREWGPQQTFGVIVGVLAVGVAGVAIYTSLQPPDTVVGFDSFYVGSGFYRNTIPYPSMQSVTLESTLPRIGFKVNGSNIGNVLRGNFRVDGWGTSRLYINRNVPPFVVIMTPDTHLVVNFSDPARTRQLYSSLRTQMRRAVR